MEREFVDWLAEHLPSHPLLRLGIGDDAALLALGAQSDSVVTTDLLADGTHFLVEETDPHWIGRKCLAVNLSDLAAMAAVPVAVVVSILLPREGAGRFDTLRLAQRLYEGMLPLAAEFEVAIAGGDTNVWDGRLAMSITAIGRTVARGPLLRSGGESGDRLLVTGELGGSLVGRHLTFTPRLHEAHQLHREYDLHAGIDITDGLAIDASRLARASGLAAVIDTQNVPISAEAAQLAMAEGGQPLDHALADGEDFELLLAVASDTAEELLKDQPLACGLTDIGELVADKGLWQSTADGARMPLPPKGYVHGR